MKKPILKVSLIISLIVVFSTTFLQEINAQTPNFGASFGMNFAKWRGDVDLYANNLNIAMEEQGIYGYDFNPISRKGIHFGFYYEGSLTKKLKLRVELNYSQKGSKLRHKGDITIYDGWDEYVFDVEQKVVDQLDYLELPILIRYNFLDNTSGITPYIVLGPTAGWLMTSKLKIVTKVDDDSDTDTEKESGYKKFDVGVYGGFGVSFDEAMLLEFRYNYNFISLLDTEIADPYMFYNNMFSIIIYTNWID